MKTKETKMMKKKDPRWSTCGILLDLRVISSVPKEVLPSYIKLVRDAVSTSRDKERRKRKMSELLNQKSSIQGKIPSGYLNSIFDLTGSWLNDAADAKYLAFDGYFISLYYLHLTASSLALHGHVKKAVPSHWNPASLSRFIKTYGTHIIVGMAVGGHDLLCIKQRPTSPIPPAELKGYLEDLGDCLFSDNNSPILDRKVVDNKKKVPEVFNRMLQAHTMQFTSITETSSKDVRYLILHECDTPFGGKGLISGSAELREQAALGLGELIEVTSEQALKSFVIPITGY